MSAERGGGEGAARRSFLLAEAARSECAPSMRAVKNHLAALFGQREREVKVDCGMCPGGLIQAIPMEGNK